MGEPGDVVYAARSLEYTPEQAKPPITLVVDPGTVGVINSIEGAVAFIDWRNLVQVGGLSHGENRKGLPDEAEFRWKFPVSREGDNLYKLAHLYKFAVGDVVRTVRRSSGHDNDIGVIK